MPWPPTSGSTTGYLVSPGGTNPPQIRWGTDGLLQLPLPPGSGYYIVSRFGQKELAEPIKLPNGTGLTVTRVFISDGAEFTITVRDDPRMTPPQVGDTIRIVDALGALGAPGAVGYVYTATVTNNNYDSAPKQAGERVLTAEHLYLIEGAPGSAGTQGSAQT